MSEFEQLWKQACEDYVRTTERAPREYALLKEFRNADNVKRHLEASQQKFDGWRKKHRMTFTALAKVTKSLEKFAQLAQYTLCATPISPASAMLGAVIFIVDAANGVSEAYDWIAKLFEKLGEFVIRLEQYMEGGMHNQLQNKVVAILSCLLEILGRSEKAIKNGRFRKFTAVLFLGQDEKVKELFDRLSTLIDDEGRLVFATLYATRQRIAQNTEENTKASQRIESKLEQVACHFQDAVSQGQQYDFDKIIDQELGTPASRTSQIIYSEYIENMLPNSGEWLLAEQKFQDWMSRKSPVIWVSGGPGTGKSYLSAMTISKLKTLYPDDQELSPPVSVGFFYVKEREQDLKDFGNLLKSIAYQITRSDPNFRNHAFSVCSKSERIISPRKIWENLFLNFFGNDENENESSAIVVIDGLDEAPSKTKSSLLRCIQDLMHLSQPKPRLCFALFGRPELAEDFEFHLGREMSWRDSLVIEIGDKNGPDIDRYIKQHIMDVQVVRQTLKLKSIAAAKTLARKIRDRLLDKADGMFFKVVLIMDELYGKAKESAIFDTIERAPPQLDAMIRRVFERLGTLQDDDKEELEQILLWVAYSKRPLSIAELYGILQLRDGETHDILEERLRGRFASLFKLSRVVESTEDEVDVDGEASQAEEAIRCDIDLFSDCEGENGDSQWDDDSNEARQLSKKTVRRFWAFNVHFTHASIKEYLLRTAREHGVPPLDASVGIQTSTADLYIASVCIQQILNFDPDDTNWRKISYAAQYFMDHLLSIETQRIDSQDMQPLIHQLCDLFFHPTGLRKLLSISQMNYNKALHLWFNDTRFATVIRREWIAHAIGEQFTDEENDWLKKSSTSTKHFFSPLATAAANMWLTKSGHDDDDYCDDRFQLYLSWIIYCNQITGDNVNEHDQQFNLGGLTAGFPPSYEIDRLQNLVDAFDLPKTQHFHTCFGWLLMVASLYEEAILHFKDALKIDKKSWKALQGLSRCLVGQENYDEAVKHLEEALQVVPEAMEYSAFSLRTELASVFLSKMDFDAAFQHAQKNYSTEPMNIDAVECYITALYAKHKYNEIVKVVENFDRLNAQSKWKSTLLSLRGVHQEIASSFRAMRKLETLKRLINDSLRTIDNRRNPWLVAWIGECMYWAYDDIDEPMSLFESILDPKFRANLDAELTWAYEYPSFSAKDHLSQIYFQKAVSEHQSGGNPQYWMEKLQGLVPETTNNDKVQGSGTALAPWLMGIYQYRFGDPKGSSSKVFFRGQILQAVDNLRNDSDMIDFPQSNILCSSLLASCDRPNAIIAAAAGCASHWKAVSGSSKCDVSEDWAFTKGWLCDGRCTTMFKTYKRSYRERYKCEICPDIDFCEECYTIVKRGELPFRKCSPEHTFIQIAPPSEEMKMVALRFYDKSTNALSDWLDSLWEKWKE